MEFCVGVKGYAEGDEAGDDAVLFQREVCPSCDCGEGGGVGDVVALGAEQFGEGTGHVEVIVVVYHEFCGWALGGLTV